MITYLLASLFLISQISAVLSVIVTSQVVSLDVTEASEVKGLPREIWLIVTVSPLAPLILLAFLFLCNHRKVRQYIVSQNFESHLTEAQLADGQDGRNKIKVRYPLFLVGHSGNL